jgi:hypothetical protein
MQRGTHNKRLLELLRVDWDAELLGREVRVVTIPSGEVTIGGGSVRFGSTILRTAYRDWGGAEPLDGPRGFRIVVTRREP